jgi:hypothetical protein
MPHRYLKGSRKLGCRRELQSPLGFKGGTASGTATGGATATGVGSAQTRGEECFNVAVADASGSGEFIITSGSSGFADTMFGSATGSAAGGGTGSQGGNVAIMMGGAGTLAFDGTTTSSGTGDFGAGFSPVQFNTVVTEVPGSPIPETFGSPKKGGSSGGFTPPTFVTTVIPVSTGPTGGFGSGSGALDIASTTTGTLIAETTTGLSTGTGSSGGEATSFGGGMGSGTTFLGTAGGLGSGAATGAGATAGNTKNDQVGGIFAGASDATGNFGNQGSGNFGGRPTTLAFPP